MGRRVVFGLCAVLVAVVVWLSKERIVAAQDPTPIVYVIPINGMIDLGLAPFLARTILEAKEAGAAAVLLDINTFGGRVDAAIAMRDALLESPVRTIAFINPRAISAGALIALATETIVMAEGGTIGAAAPIVGGAGETKPADEKTVSYLRKEFRATADVRKRPPEVAEAMVDADVEIAGVSAKGKLLTLTTSEAIEQKVADWTAPSIDAALKAVGLSGAERRESRQTWAETFVRFLTDPVVSSLLMSLGLLGLFVEIRTPGFTVPGALGLTFLGLFFWGHWIVRLAGWEELLLVAIGVGLIALEVFVLPGMTIAGVAGGVALLAGLGLTLVGAGATASVIIQALGQVAIALLLAFAGAFGLLRLLPSLPFGRRLVLSTGMQADLGYVSTPDSDLKWLERVGTSVSPLRPAGIAEIDGARIDVVSDGGFIEVGAAIQVVRVDGNRIVVRRASPRKEDTHE